jgi:uncharacterized protein YodC (DUF2158 family)
MFKAGDVVMLKSGGPKMTVQRLIGDKSHPMAGTVDEYLKIKGCKEGDPICQWFAGAEMKSDAFKKEMLEMVP